MESISRPVPLRKTVATASKEIIRIRDEMAIQNHHLLFTLDDCGTFFSSSLHAPFVNKEFGFLVLSDIKAI
jgi:hypothetical protein